MSSKYHANIFSLQVKVLILLCGVFASATMKKEEPQDVDNWNFRSPNILNYTWTISPEYWYPLSDEYNIESPVFSGNEIGEYQWQIHLNRVEPWSDDQKVYLKLISGE